MPAEVLERPAHLFNSETGKQNAYLSHAAQEELKQAGRLFQQMAIERAEQAKFKPQTDTDALREAERQIELVNEQLTRTRALLNEEPTAYCEHCEQGGTMPGNHRAALLREYRGLMEHLCMLRGIAPPKAGRGSSSVQRPTVTAPTVAPTQPIVVAPANTGPNPSQST